jgi:hypothetical protein
LSEAFSEPVANWVDAAAGALAMPGRAGRSTWRGALEAEIDAQRVVEQRHRVLDVELLRRPVGLLHPLGGVRLAVQELPRLNGPVTLVQM